MNALESALKLSLLFKDNKNWYEHWDNKAEKGGEEDVRRELERYEEGN